MRLPIQALVYVTRRIDGRREYLMLHRVRRGDDFWQGVSGGVESGETIEEAARRELMEETGFAPIRFEDIDVSYTFPLAEKWRALYALGVSEIREHVFVAEVGGDHDPVIDPREHDEWRWCGFDDALALLSWPDNIIGLRAADAVVRDWAG